MHRATHPRYIDLTAVWAATRPVYTLFALQDGEAFSTTIYQAKGQRQAERGPDAFEDCSFSKLAERYGLSQREAQVAELFAQGRNGAYIQEVLCLSKSTVSTHRQHVYQKFGIHNQQELIELYSAAADSSQQAKGRSGASPTPPL